MDEVLAIKKGLERARAEEAKALRRANDVRAKGTHSELELAMRDVDRLHCTVSSLQSELRQRLSPKQG